MQTSAQQNLSKRCPVIPLCRAWAVANTQPQPAPVTREESWCWWWEAQEEQMSHNPWSQLHWREESFLCLILWWESSLGAGNMDCSIVLCCPSCQTLIFSISSSAWQTCPGTFAEWDLENDRLVTENISLILSYGPIHWSRSVRRQICWWLATCTHALKNDKESI